jgi:tRNA 2-selenouridine synthase
MLDAMRAADCVRIDLPLDRRVALLRDEYAHFVDDPSRLAAPLAALVPLHGKAEIEQWSALAQCGDWDTFVRTLLKRHYDPAYGRAIERNFPNFARGRVVVLGGIAEADFRAVARPLIEQTAEQTR